MPPDSPMTDEMRRRLEHLADVGLINSTELEERLASLEAQTPAPRLNALAWAETPVQQHVRAGRFVRAHTRRELRVLAEKFLDGDLTLEEYLRAREATGVPLEYPAARRWRVPRRTLPYVPLDAEGMY